MMPRLPNKLFGFVFMVFVVSLHGKGMSKPIILQFGLVMHMDLK